MITDLVQLRTIAEAKAAENLDFQRFVRQHHGSAHLFREIALEVESKIDCRQCGACCRETYVDVTPAEIAAIAEYLGTSAENAAHEYTMIDPTDHHVILRHSGGGCTFLDGNICMIYEARPGPCRHFPHIDSSSHTLGSRMESVTRRTGYCPIVYNTLEGYKRRLGYHYHPHAGQ